LTGIFVLVRAASGLLLTFPFSSRPLQPQSQPARQTSPLLVSPPTRSPEAGHRHARSLARRCARCDLQQPTSLFFVRFRLVPIRDFRFVTSVPLEPMIQGAHGADGQLGGGRVESEVEEVSKDDPMTSPISSHRAAASSPSPPATPRPTDSTSNDYSAHQPEFRRRKQPHKHHHQKIRRPPEADRR
jgi:hypothetical protein